MIPLPDGSVPAGCVAGDGFVQGDPTSPFPNGEILSPNTTPSFGTGEVTDHVHPDWATGWGNKPSNWEFTASVEHQVADGISFDVGYFRRSYVNFGAVDDLNTTRADWDPFTLRAPDNEHLPADVRGAEITLYDLDPAAVAQADNLTVPAGDVGGRVRRWQGIDANFSIRREGVLLQGGYSVGQDLDDRCGLREGLFETLNGEAGDIGGLASTGNPTAGLLEHCRVQTPWLGQASVFGSYTLPYDVEVAGTFFSRTGPRRLAIWQVPAAVAGAALGRAPTNTNILVNLVPPGTEYGDRLNQFDLRLAKLLDFGGLANLRASLDIHNLFNGNAVARERHALGPTYLLPVGLQPGRLAKVTFQLNF